MLAFDTETALIESAKLAPELSCLTWSDGESCGITHWTDSYTQARNLLEQEITTANGAYDLAVLWAAHPDLKDLIWDGLVNGRYHDVLIRQKLMDIGAGCYRRVFKRLPGADKPTLLRYSLSDLHARYYGQHMEKDEWRLRYGELRPVPLAQWPQGAIRYAQYDAVATARIHDLQNTAAVEQGRTHNLWDEASQMRAAFALHLASCWGFRTDLKQVEKVIGQIDNEQPGLARKLLSAGLVRNKTKKGDGEYTRSEKIAKGMMYAAVGDAGELTDTGYKKVKAGELTKTQALAQGYIKIDEEWCEVSGKPELIAYYQFRQNQLLRAKLAHIQTAAFYSIPIQTSFEVLMETGRTSSSENKLIRNSMALQNPPRKGGMRECFIARPGCTLIASDFGQAELVALAQITYAAFGYSKMRDLLNAGMDLHVDFAKEIISIESGRKMTYAEAWALHKAKDAMMKSRRTLSKGFSFGKPGGLGAASFQSYVRKAWGVTITFEQSKSLGQAWLRHFPEMRDYFKWMSELVEAGGGYADIQQYMSGRWRGKCYYTQSCNCVDDETEALTKRGWVKGFDLVPGDVLLTKNMHTGVLEWQAAWRIQKYPNYYGRLVEFKTKNFSAVTTPDHRWLVTTKKGVVECKTTTEIGSNGDARIHRVGAFAGATAAVYTDAFVELVGWVLTDGTIHKTANQLTVYQSQRANPQEVRKIDALFRRLGLLPARSVMRDGSEGVRWTLSGGCALVHQMKQMFPQRILSAEFLFQLTLPQLELLWSTMMLGDGACEGRPYLPRNKGRHQQRFSTRSKAAADAFQHLCTLIGFSSESSWLDTSKHIPKKSPKMRNIPKTSGVWLVRILKRETVQVVNLKKKYGISKTVTQQRRDFVGKARMWCPVVSNTYFVARRRGTVYITGNTMFQGLTADAAKAAFFEVSRLCYTVRSSDLYGCRPLLFLHDEVITEAPKEQAAEAAAEKEKVMVEVYSRYTPDVRITADAHLMDRWSKDAEAVHDERGKLVPWNPPQDEDEVFELLAV